MSPYLYDHIEKLLNKRNYREVQKILKELPPKKMEPETKEEQQEILDDLYERGLM